MTSNSSADIRKNRPKHSFIRKVKMPKCVTYKGHRKGPYKIIAIPELDPKAIGERIRAARIARDFTVQHLATKSGLAIQTLYAFEDGTRIPRRDSLMRLAITFNRTMDYFLWGRHREGKSRVQSRSRPGSVSDSFPAWDSDSRSADCDSKVSSR